MLFRSPAGGPAGKRDTDLYKEPYKVTVKDVNKQFTTTSSSKGKWYEPVNTDKRDMGARRKNYLSTSGIEQGGRRKTHKGYDELENLGKGMMQESNYQEVERSILMAKSEIDRLISSLEKKKDETKS